MTPQQFGDLLYQWRKDRKLSQEALGSLVGRTGGAVSTWERGEASPPVEVIRRLAEVLKVDVRELMGDKQPLVPLEGWDLIQHRAALWDKAMERLHKVYGEKPPLPVLNRFWQEKNVLGFTDVIILFDITRELLLDAEKKEKQIEGDGIWYGSFVAWLMGASPINPLLAHYFCPKCKKMEFRREVLSGWDLPAKRCECGEQMIRDGHDLPFDVYLIGSGTPFETMEINLPMSYLEDAQKLILRMAGPYFSLRRHVADAKGGRYLPKTSLFFEAKKKENPPEYIEDIEQIEELYNGGTSISYPAFELMPLPEVKRTGRKPKKRIPILDDLLQEEVLVQALGRFNSSKQSEKEFSGMDFTIRDPEKYRAGITFSKLVSIICAMQNAYMKDNPESMAEAVGLDLTVMPSSWEDLWKLIISSAGNPAEVGGFAGMIVLNCRNGHYINYFKESDGELFEQLHLPDWFPEYARLIMTLDFRCRATIEAYRLMNEVWQRMQVER